MNQSDVLIALHEMDGIGWKTIRLLRDRYASLEEVLGSRVDELCRLGILPARAERIARQLTEAYIRRVSERYADGRILPVTIDAPDYPELLLQTAEPPWVLYTRGRRELLNRPSIAIVGTRTPTVYGKRVAEMLSKDLSAAGITVVSGIARGIDGVAHIGALTGQGSTVAVLGNGIDIIYPKEHAALYRQIQEEGLIVSEYKPGLVGTPGLFPQRNRIIAGMSMGTLVVEAAKRSGSLITAQMALEESREVFAVPGPLTSPKSEGCHALIQSGAKLVTGVHDLLAEYKHIIGIEAIASPIPAKSPVTPEEARLLRILEAGPCTIDELAERSETNFGHLFAILLSLQMSKRIEQLPGSVYVLI